MKKYFNVLVIFFFSSLIISALKVEAILPLTGRTIVVDAGHGKEDPGTSYGKIYEKDINLKISLYLYDYLSSLGANAILTRDGDYDLSSPKTSYRKKSDFDNRIKLINQSNADLYLSIHLNYLSDNRYKGPQVFSKESDVDLAKIVQNKMNAYLNGNRKIKSIPVNTYMYNKIKISGLLIECGFLSNMEERNLLVTEQYQRLIAKSIGDAVTEYFSS